MCKAFSAVVDRSGKVYWKRGLDSHEEIKKHFKLVDDDANKLVAIEISPKDDNYYLALQGKQEWKFLFDNDKEIPSVDWWKQSHEKACWHAHKTWVKDVNALIDFSYLSGIKNPFENEAKMGKEQEKLLEAWDSVRASVWDSVRNSVGDSVWASVGDSVRASVWASVGDSMWDSVRASVRASVWDSVWASVWDSVRDSVWDSVGDSVGAQIGCGFKIPRKDWKYCEKIKGRGYPFMPAVRLWRAGLVPVKYGDVWRLFGKKDGKVQELYALKKG